MTAPAVRRVRMEDIARAAGVSQPTVSLVLSGRKDVRIAEATRRRVVETAARLRYRIDGTAAALSAGRTGAVALAFDASASFLMNDPFCRDVLAGVVEATEAERLSLLFSRFDARAGSVGAVERSLADGVLYLAAKRPEAVAYLRASGVPFVLLNPDLDAGGEAAVLLDDAAAGRLAAERLRRAGARRALFLSASWRGRVAPAYRARAAGFRASMPAARTAVLPLDGRPGDSYRLGVAAAARLGGATAVGCANDRIAWGLVDALIARGVRVGAEVSVCGIDGLERPDAPAVETVAFDRADVGRTGLHLLRRLLDGDSAAQVRLEPQAQPGETVGAPRRGRRAA